MFKYRERNMIGPTGGSFKSSKPRLTETQVNDYKIWLSNAIKEGKRADIPADIKENYSLFSIFVVMSVDGWTYDELLNNEFLRQYWPLPVWLNLFRKLPIIWDAREVLGISDTHLLEDAPMDETFIKWVSTFPRPFTLVQQYNLYRRWACGEVTDEIAESWGIFVQYKEFQDNRFIDQEALFLTGTQNEYNLFKFFCQAYNGVLNSLMVSSYDEDKQEEPTVQENELLSVIRLYQTLGVRLSKPPRFWSVFSRLINNELRDGFASLIVN